MNKKFYDEFSLFVCSTISYYFYTIKFCTINKMISYISEKSINYLTWTGKFVMKIMNKLLKSFKEIAMLEQRKGIQRHCQLLLSLLLLELMTCKIFFKVRVQIENLACCNLLTKEYFISAKDRGDGRKKDIHQNYFVSRILLHFFISLLVQFSSKWFLIYLLLLFSK